MTRVVDVRKERCDVYVGRPTYWGNPFIVGRDGDREHCIELYRRMMMLDDEMTKRARDELVGKVLGCYCAPKPCHADVLLEVVNGRST